MDRILDYLLPWDFSPTVAISVALAATLFIRGARRGATPASQRLQFFMGLGLIYCALQTKWDYYAGHMFFVHRMQHLVLHDLGPFLLAWSAPMAVIGRGLPPAMRTRLEAFVSTRSVRAVRHAIFEPWTATGLFIASLCIWVWPSVHFYVMLSNWLYTLMNWSVLLIDLPFWWLILDPRPPPASRLSQGKRILMLVLVMVPMILVGAIIGLSRHDLYPVYQLCGRFLPISPVTDQQIGGLIIWIAGSLLASVAALIALARALEQSRHTEQPLRADVIRGAYGR